MHEEIVRYYEDTGMDYRAWSRGFNMHFGYWRPWLNPFRREPMLEEMNAQILRLLPIEQGTVLDLGCGLGATIRHIAKRRPGLTITGVTFVPWQVETATKLNRGIPNTSVMQADYLDLPLPSDSADGAYALESCCHAPGEDKGRFLTQLHRVLKPGGRFVIADGFTKRERRSGVFDTLSRWACEGWALSCFPSLRPFLRKLDELGFQDVTVREISWQIAPSVMHAPPLVIAFLIGKQLQGEKLNRTRLAHLRSCLVSLAVGAHRWDFGYYLISGRKQV